MGARKDARHLTQSFAYHLAHDTWLPSAVLKERRELPATAEAAPEARQWAGSRLAALLGEEDLEIVEIVEILVTELVTNAVVHAGIGADDSIVLHMALAPERVRVEVCDGGAGFSAGELERRRSEPGGYGLLMVDRACSRWGIASDEGNCVWFELDRERPDR